VSIRVAASIVTQQLSAATPAFMRGFCIFSVNPHRQARIATGNQSPSLQFGNNGKTGGTQVQHWHRCGTKVTEIRHFLGLRVRIDPPPFYICPRFCRYYKLLYSELAASACLDLNPKQKPVFYPKKNMYGRIDNMYVCSITPSRQRWRPKDKRTSPKVKISLVKRKLCHDEC
jgi:hypothetical protein